MEKIFSNTIYIFLYVKFALRIVAQYNNTHLRAMASICQVAVCIKEIKYCTYSAA